MPRLAFLLPFILTLSCATKSIHLSPSTPPTIDIKGVISLLYPSGGTGHACPCDNAIYTARHIIQSKNMMGSYNLDSPAEKFTWQDGYGNSGVAEGITYNEYKDLGQIKIRIDTTATPTYTFYTQAPTLPEPGEKITWVEYNEKDFFNTKKEAKVRYYFAGYVFFDKLPTPGASGSCIFNSKGEVIGVIVWGVIRSSQRSGVGALLDPKFER